MSDMFLHAPVGSDGRSQGARTLRSRQDSLNAAADRATVEPGLATARHLVQIYDGGHMPTTPDHFYFSHPVEIDGAETEGGSGTPTADTTQTIAVDVLGHAPSVGDILTAYAIGGRWVAERGSSGGIITVPCAPCAIPKRDLTLSWVNIISGNGSTTLTYSPSPDIWKTGCIGGQIYELLCSEGTIELVVTYFISGNCPSGQSNFCSNLRVYPFGLVLSSSTCSPFSVSFTVGPGCPEVEAPGYTSFAITL